MKMYHKKLVTDFRVDLTFSKAFHRSCDKSLPSLVAKSDSLPKVASSLSREIPVAHT